MTHGRKLPPLSRVIDARQGKIPVSPWRESSNFAKACEDLAVTRPIGD